MSPQLARYRESRGEKVSTGATLLERFTAPLLFEPGTSWQYGPSIDWAGRLVERLTDMSLEEYMRENLWKPLGIKDMTFFPARHADMQARLSGMTLRDPQGGGTAVDYAGPTLNTGVTDCLGGQGCYATMPEYMKVLHSLLVDDEKLLAKATTRQMFEPHLTAPAKKFMNSLRDRPEVWTLFVGHFPRHVDLDWGLAGMLTVQHDEGWREDRTLIWSGLPNLFWVSRWAFCSGACADTDKLGVSSSIGRRACLESSARRFCRRGMRRWTSSLRCLRRPCINRSLQQRCEVVVC